MSFRDLGLKEELVSAVEAMGFENPTPIQEKTITHLSEEATDIIGLAQTGTGKTAAFGLPLLQQVDDEQRHTQGLIVCPTRELCIQIANELTNYSKFMKRLNIVAVYGGTSIDKQKKDLRRGAQIVVATPGRLIDLINQKAVKLENVGVAVLDEADEMFNMGFHDDVDEILGHLSEDHLTWLFSATMSKPVEKVVKKYMEAPAEISCARNESAANIEHVYYMTQGRHRYEGLKRVIDATPDIFGVIFCRTRKETQEVSEQLARDGYNAEALHGDLSQAQRSYVMRKFRERSLQLLVATDVAARGIDVNDVTHVINYQLPEDLEVYTHRSGRTGRAGKSGTSIILATPRDERRLQDLSRFIKKEITYAKLPSGSEVCEKQLYAFVDRVMNVEVNEEEIEQFLPAVYEKVQEMSKEDLIQRFVSTEFNRFLEYYKGSEDINARRGSRDRGDRGDRGRDRYGRDGGRDRGDRRGGRRGTNNGYERFFINVGALDNIKKGGLLRAICDKTGIQSNNIGAIDMFREYSFFDVQKERSGKVLTQLHGSLIDGRKVRVEIAGQAKKSRPRHGNRERAPKR